MIDYAGKPIKKDARDEDEWLLAKNEERVEGVVSYLAARGVPWTSARRSSYSLREPKTWSQIRRECLKSMYCEDRR
jgi:hypothetical protein